MKTTIVVKTAFSILLVCSIGFLACQKNSNPPANQQQDFTVISTSEDEADNIFNNVFDNVMGTNAEVGLGTGIGVFGRSAGHGTVGKPDGSDSTSHCFTVTITPETPEVFPKTVIIDFGDGCLGSDGRTRKGKIITVFSGRMITPGSTATTTFQDYYVNNILVEGTHIIQNNSISNNAIFTVTVHDGKLTGPNGNYIEWNKIKTWTQIDGNGTPDNPLDNIYSITGSSNGTLHIGDSTRQWSTETLKPLIRKFVCSWITQGQLSLTWDDLNAVLDFGDGGCDNKATVTFNGKTYNIYLH